MFGDDQLLTGEQAAAMLQIPEDTLRTWRTVRGIGGHKKPPFLRIGRRIRYRLGDLRRYVMEMR